MIKTTYKVAIEIDEKTFNIVVREPKKQDKDELQALSVSHTELFEERNDLSANLTKLSEEYEINKQLTKESDLIDKAKLLWEQKKLNKEIYDLQAKIKEHDKSASSSSETLETLFEKRFDLLVSGTDKEPLRQALDAGGVSYRDLFVEIGNLVIKAKEKK
jgi:mevalonate kinase